MQLHCILNEIVYYFSGIHLELRYIPRRTQPQGSRKTVAKSPMVTITIIWLQNIGYGGVSGDKGRPATARASFFSRLEESGVHFYGLYQGPTVISKIDSIALTLFGHTCTCI